MKSWCVREDLSSKQKLRRSYYKLLRDSMDQFILKYSLIDSYNNFLSAKISYPFVEMRELKPRGRIPLIEHECQNSFLIIFVEDIIPDKNKKYIRFLDANKSTKINLLKNKVLSLSNKFDRGQKYLDSIKFENFIMELLPVDYALLIQRDVKSKVNDRYCLSHFHVKVDWPIADATEDLARRLRYISKDIYEKGDKYAEDLQKKFKSVLIKLDKQELKYIAETNSMSQTSFSKNYIIARQGQKSICLFTVFYYYTNHSRPPSDGKLRDFSSERYWLTVEKQLILPKPGVWSYPPIHYNMIYG
ncbi:MAG: hypothetical protein B6I31_05365 [Desulfobacteraceae bacterium 4572_19]|nr:MAG: hypothetical protein B6I31_05365 [Desulfobacteraceae bacterium 4572_19]